MSAEPVEIEVVRVCAFKAKPCGVCGKPRGSKDHTPKHSAVCKFRRQNGCVNCGKPKADAAHLGAPESFNAFDTAPFAYETAKKRWTAVLVPLLAASGLPRGLGAVTVEAEVSFGDLKDRDQGNHRIIIEKALGDVLQAEGYLDADSWQHYQFGNLERREEPGINRLRLMLFPSLEPLPIAGLYSVEQMRLETM